MLPVPVLTRGGWHPASFAVVKEFLRTVASRTLQRDYNAQGISLQHQSVLIITTMRPFQEYMLE